MVVRELHEVHQGVVFQDQGELVTSRTPVGDARSDAQVHFKRYLLCQSVNKNVTHKVTASL